jgi:hypothetical protein
MIVTIAGHWVEHVTGRARFSGVKLSRFWPFSSSFAACDDENCL